MLSFSNTNGSAASQAVQLGSFSVSGTTGFAMSVYCPTARNLHVSGSTSTIADTADRTASTCFMVGYKENLRIQTSSPLPWLWRRITFCYRGPEFNLVDGDATPTNTYAPYSDTSLGMSRQWFNLQVNNMPNTVTAYNSIIFKGGQNFDWTDVITAKVDTARIDVKSDVTRRITTGNNNGHFSERKLWYPMRKNIVYDDDEVGAGENDKYFSVQSKPGMGNYYVVDYVAPGLGGTTTDLFNMNCSATLYWHEK